MLLVIVLAMMTVIGLYVFTIVQIPDEPPDIKVNFSKLNDRWTVSITSSREPINLHQFRLVVRTSEGEYATYDSDGDGLKDAIMVGTLDDLAVTSGDGPQMSPIVFVDTDGDGNLTVGDSLVVYEYYYFPSGPVLDADRGYAYVGLNPDKVPRDSTIQIVASGLTLGNDDINPGDTVRVEIKKDSTLKAFSEGPASISGTYLDQVYVDIGWEKKKHDAIFTIRPGEIDEWSTTFTFEVKEGEAITADEAAQYWNTTHPFATDDVVQLIHIPSNSVVLEFRL
jgi:hypothetical protein